MLLQQSLCMVQHFLIRQLQLIMGMGLFSVDRPLALTILHGLGKPAHFYGRE